MSEDTLRAVDTEVRRLIEECHGVAPDLLDVRHRLDALAAALLEREILDQAEAYAAAGPALQE